MRKYKLRKQHFTEAKRLGVEIKPSTNKGKKIDVLRPDGKKFSIGAKGYKDYVTYQDEDGEIASVKRDAYHARHDCKNKKKGTAGYYSCNILW